MTSTSSVLTLWVPIGLIVSSGLFAATVLAIEYLRDARRVKRQLAILDQRAADAARMKGDAR